MEIIVIVAIISSFFMGLAVGGSTVAPSFAPVNSSGPSSVLRLALLAGIFAFIGAVHQGGNVTSMVGTGISSEAINLFQGATILFVAAFLVILSVLTDIPMPTAFTVIGAVIGSTLALGNEVEWISVFQIVGYWIFTPFAALLMGYTLAYLLKKYLPEKGSEKKIRYLLYLSGAYVAYTAGGSAVGLAVGPLDALEVSVNYLLIFGGFSILAGAWLYSPRIINVVSFDYANLGPRRSIAALTSAGVLAQIGIFLSVPISFNLAIIASVIGSGLIEGKSNMEGNKIFSTVSAWVGAFFTSVILTYLVIMVFSL